MDLISRQDAIDAVAKILSDREGGNAVWWKPVAKSVIDVLPSAQPDNRLSKIADLVEGTIDDFDLDDAMDLLYQIKGVLK